jgi:hypothetical protein
LEHWQHQQQCGVPLCSVLINNFNNRPERDIYGFLPPFTMTAARSHEPIVHLIEVLGTGLRQDGYCLYSFSRRAFRPTGKISNPYPSFVVVMQPHARTLCGMVPRLCATVPQARDIFF